MVFCTRMEYTEPEARIRDTIDAHAALTTDYNKMMTDIEKKRLIFCLEKEDAESGAVDGRKKALYIIYTIFMLLLCIYPVADYLIKPQSMYLFKPYVKYIVSVHIRRQYQKLYSLYLAELVTHNKD